MKTVVFLSLPFFLLACGESDTNENKPVMNTGVSSVVADENPNATTYTVPVDPEKEAAAEKDLTTLFFPVESFNFGTVFYPSENLYTFKVKNTGKVPLIIESATASCGCTVPNKPEEPIPPGGTGELDVIFRPKKGQVGQTVEKKITVVANTNPAESFLSISANVIEGM